MVQSPLLPRRSFAAAAAISAYVNSRAAASVDAVASEFSFCQDCRLRLHGDLGVKTSCPADDPQIFRVDGAEPDELRDMFFVC